nr:MAG TPA: hypothetical protein [Caudoviricetes sp.]
MTSCYLNSYQIYYRRLLIEAETIFYFNEGAALRPHLAQ